MDLLRSRISAADDVVLFFARTGLTDMPRLPMGSGAGAEHRGLSAVNSNEFEALDKSRGS
jgi:hypothetical protein